MSSNLLQQAQQALSVTAIAELGVNLGDICELSEDTGGLHVSVAQGVFGDDVTELLQQSVASALQAIAPGCAVTVNVAVEPSGSLQGSSISPIPGVKNIIAVASGKGGVGKSTTAVNLALALANQGASVGILDADIYGPSQPHMLGIGDQRPDMHAPNLIEPISALGLKVISMGNLVTDNTPMVWRGPMVSGALQQLLKNTHWDNIDYLVVDMPPGTGDIQLTLSQVVPVSGAVIVTTPQDIALLDARKGVEMFHKVQIPVLGVVENMSTHICSNCGHVEAIFGERGGEQLAEEYGVETLGRLPLALSIREQTDSGCPPVAADPSSETSLEYGRIARRVALMLWQRAGEASSGPQISITDD